MLDTESSVVPPDLAGHAAARTPASRAARCRIQLPRRQRTRCCGTSVSAPDPAPRRRSSASTGAGKTTLLSLIPRLFDATGGSVVVDGVDVRDLDPDVLWDRIGLVPQKPFLFTGTVASNLRYGNPDATDEDLWEALEIAQARDFVEAMPEGIDSPIAQGGTNVSGGQRQRLAIARALVAQPSIYLFDDSFSALDLATDARLRAALKPTTRDKTVIIVAQRVSTIADADQIIVLEDGLIVGHRTARRTARDLPDLRRDRRIPARRGGVGMTTTTSRASRPPPERPQVRDRRPAAVPADGGRGPFGGIGMPAEKSLNFGPSAKRRLLGRMRSERLGLIAVVLLGVISVVLPVIGPKLLGNATDIIFDGVVSKQFPAGITQAQAIEGAARTGNDHLADMLSAMTLTPGAGIDFTALANVLMLVLALYVLASVFGCLQGYLLNGIVQRTILSCAPRSRTS